MPTLLEPPLLLLPLDSAPAWAAGEGDGDGEGLGWAAGEGGALSCRGRECMSTPDILGGTGRSLRGTRVGCQGRRRGLQARQLVWTKCLQLPSPLLQCPAHRWQAAQATRPLHPTPTSGNATLPCTSCRPSGAMPSARDPLVAELSRPARVAEGLLEATKD